MIKTMKSITTAVETLTSGGHLPEPGSVFIAPNSAVIFPELPGAPISGLIVWALHLDGDVEYTAEVVFRAPGADTVTSVTARGTIDGINVDICASTYRRDLPQLRDQRVLTKVPVTEQDLRELASTEEVLGTLPTPTPNTP